MVANKTKYRNNFFLLVFFHLFLFTYPILDKAVHLHTHDRTGEKNLCTGSPVLSAHEEDCPICDFHFFNFVTAPPLKTTICLTNFSVLQTLSTSRSYASLFHYFLLRAPPVSLS
jgi:hypothetical protein